MATMTDVMRKGFVAGRRPEDAVLGGVLRRLELARHPVYPNLLKARITERGRRRLVGHVHAQAS